MSRDDTLLIDRAMRHGGHSLVPSRTEQEAQAMAAKHRSESLWSTSSDSGRSKLTSKSAGISLYQNPNIYTPEESSR